MEKLNHQEEELMLIVYQLGKGYIREFLDKLDNPKPPYTTLASTVKNLEKKGYLKSEKHGNTFLYLPVLAEKEYKAGFLSKVVRNYFENSYKEAVSFFVEKEKISSDELKEIILMIEEKSAGK